MIYTIDAKNKKLGRLASEVAAILRGKNTPAFTPNVAPDIKVIVENLGGLDISDKKMKEKKYVTYSGYPGGQKITPMEKIVEKKGIDEVFRLAVKRMLPKNRLNSVMMKNLDLKI